MSCTECVYFINNECMCPYDSCSFEKYRPFSYTKGELEQLKHNIYNQAINELMENIKNKYACFRTESNYWCGQECNMCDFGAVRVSNIEKIAEQLKENSK